MCHTHLTLDPEADAMVSAALDATIAAEHAKPDSGRSFDQRSELRADAPSPIGMRGCSIGPGLNMGWRRVWP